MIKINITNYRIHTIGELPVNDRKPEHSGSPLNMDRNGIKNIPMRGSVILIDVPVAKCL